MAGERSVTVALETVTPLFMAGAEPRGEPELRPPAFRGALRYWLRAALGGALGGDLAAVRQAEAAVFGSTDERAGGAGAVTVRVRQDAELPTDRYDRGGMTGHGYLYWSMAHSGSRDRGNFQPAKAFIEPGTPFDLILTPRPGTRGGGAALDQAAAALWLLLHLGGVGSRSRRTGGSLSARGAQTAAGLPFHLGGRTSEAIATELATGLRRVRELTTDAPPPALTGTPAFDILHPQTCTVWVLDLWPHPDVAVNRIGAYLRDFRSGQLATAARAPATAKPALAERAVFGLPLPSRDKSLGVINGRAEHEDLDRRASPLWLSVTKTAGGQAVGVATLFRSRFLPEGADLRGTGGRTAPPPTDYGLIERWIAAAFPNAREVRYG